MHKTCTHIFPHICSEQQAEFEQLTKAKTRHVSIVLHVTDYESCSVLIHARVHACHHRPDAVHAMKSVACDARMTCNTSRVEGSATCMLLILKDNV